MKNALQFIFPALLFLMIFSLPACEKEESFSNEELLTLHTWKYVNMSADTDDQTTQDLLNLVKLFMATSTIDFNDDATYSWFIYDTTNNGSWELSSSGLLLTMDKGSDDESVQTIAELTETKMVWETPGETTGGATYTLTMEWGK